MPDAPSTAPEPPVEPPRPPGTFRIGQVAGADVLVSGSWFLVAALIAVLLAPRVEQVEPGLGVWRYVVGLVFAAVLYGSVLLHEASHAVVARRLGYRVSSITLHFLGGATQVEGEARTARQEFLIAVVGPLTSLAVGGVGVALWFVTPDGLLLMAVEALAGANLLVGVLNLLPALPLDGGRVLKAGVWGVTGDMFRGTVVAAWGGRVLAVLVLGWPWLQYQLFEIEPTLVDYLIGFVVGTFLWTGASAALAQTKLRRRLPKLVARPLARRVVAVPADMPLGTAVERAQTERAGSIVTLDTDGRPVGLVSEAALDATPQERRPWLPTSAVSRTLHPGLCLPVDIAGEALVVAMSRHRAEEYLLVEEDGRVFGVLTASDVDQAFAETGH